MSASPLGLDPQVSLWTQNSLPFFWTSLTFLGANPTLLFFIILGILELLIKTYKSFTYDHMDYKEDLKRRDMMDLPKYWHRDDAVMLWEATLNYVREMVDAFYISDDDVLKDWELQTWVGDVFNQGFSQLAGTVKPGLGVPSKLNSKEELVGNLDTSYKT